MKLDMLVTYSCTHYAVMPEDAYDTTTEAYIEDFDDLCTSAHDDLEQQRIALHISYPQPCPLRSCNALSLEEWAYYIQDAEEHLQKVLDEIRTIYLAFAKNYHRLNPLVLAKSQNERKCALAHKQFANEARKWTEDPFFKPWLQLLKGHAEVKRALNNRKVPFSTAIAERLSKTVNGCRYSISRIYDAFRDLESGIEFLQLQKLSGKGTERIVVVDGLPPLLPLMRSMVEKDLRRTLAQKGCSDKIKYIFTPVSHPENRLAGFAFIEFKSARDAHEAQSISESKKGGIPLTKSFPMTISKLTEVSKTIDKPQVDNFRQAGRIDAAHHAKIDHMLTRMKLRAKMDFALLSRKDETATLSGQALQNHVAEFTTADRAYRRFKRRGTRRIDDCHDSGEHDPRHMQVFIFANALLEGWKMRMAGYDAAFRTGLHFEDEGYASGGKL